MSGAFIVQRARASYHWGTLAMPVSRTDSGHHSASARQSASYQRKKEARERLNQVRARVADFICTVLEPGLRAISTEMDWPLDEIRQLAHLALPSRVQQRRLSLWQAVMRIAREETSDWDSAIASAQRTYSELQQAIECGNWDDPLLVEYEQLREDMEQGRGIKNMPKTAQQTVRAKLGMVARCHKDIDEKLQILSNSAGIEFFVVITTGDKLVKFAPFISATRKVADFLPFKFKTTADQFATEMEGFALFGSEAYTMLASKNPQHKAQVSKLLTAQLRTLTGDPKVTLRWKEDTLEGNYDSLSVSLVGWPEDITFRPLMFLSASQARRLHLAIREGKLRFEKQSTPSQRPPVASTASAAGTRRRRQGRVTDGPSAQVSQVVAQQAAPEASSGYALPAQAPTRTASASASVSVPPTPMPPTSALQIVRMSPSSPAPTRIPSATQPGPSSNPVHTNEFTVPAVHGPSEAGHAAVVFRHASPLHAARRGAPSGQMAIHADVQASPIPTHSPHYPPSPMLTQSPYLPPTPRPTQYLPIHPEPLPPPPPPPFASFPFRFTSPYDMPQ